MASEHYLSCAQWQISRNSTVSHTFQRSTCILAFPVTSDIKPLGHWTALPFLNFGASPIAWLDWKQKLKLMGNWNRSLDYANIPTDHSLPFFPPPKKRNLVPLFVLFLGAETEKRYQIPGFMGNRTPEATMFLFLSSDREKELILHQQLLLITRFQGKGIRFGHAYLHSKMTGSLKVEPHLSMAPSCHTHTQTRRCHTWSRQGTKF